MRIISCTLLSSILLTSVKRSKFLFSKIVAFQNYSSNITSAYLPKLCTVSLHFNFITPGWHQIKSRQLKMTTILEPLKAFHISWFVVLRYFAYFLKKLVRAVLHVCRFALVVPGPFPRLKIEDNCFTAIAGWIPTS